ncbi:hemicentin-1-like [Mizuhopecten yessoensis]|uniref:hemicentin-1-like n=1 Tax=Mizuhopecten yessoensis TaxID=6573 RepID=UPI000B459218|nr:hemicentin-1-like [Mizuhopecten yessoensis]
MHSAKESWGNPVYIPPPDYDNNIRIVNQRGPHCADQFPDQTHYLHPVDIASNFNPIGSHTLSGQHIYDNLADVLPKREVRSYRPVIVIIVVVLGLVILAAVGAPTLYITVFKPGAQEGNPPVNGIWNDWQSWSDCSATCGNGDMTRNRTCDNPPPSFGGNYCEGTATENQSCKLTNCSVNGNWSVWLAWSSCSVSCDNGTRIRNRTCDHPVPAFGGEECDGIYTDSEVCMIIHCPINGNWSSWRPWSDCSTTCGGGIKNRTRICDNPAPEHLGLDCDGHGFESSTCGEVTCPPPGVWGTWTEWADCSVSCGVGVSSRTRICDNSAGGECIGTNSETKWCQHRFKCYDSWGDWGACSVTCGSGIQTRNRTCDGKFTGQECGWNPPTFRDKKTCVNPETCDVYFCASRNASCFYNHPNRCDLYIECDENKVMHEDMCNVLLRFKLSVDDECDGYCDWEASVPCSL